MEEDEEKNNEPNGGGDGVQVVAGGGCPVRVLRRVVGRLGCGQWAVGSGQWVDGCACCAKWHELW